MYDAVIVGAGVAGVFAAYRLSQIKQKILLIDKGPDLSERLERITSEPQIQYQGFGGLGFSEGKYNYSLNCGGNIAGKIGAEVSASLMREVDEVLCRFGGKDATFYHTDNAELHCQSEQAGLEMLSTAVRHLGTEKSQNVLIALRHYLADKVDFLFNVEPRKLTKIAEGFSVLMPNDSSLMTRNIILATGNLPSVWLQQQLAAFDIEEGKTRLDMGLRIEMPYQQWRSLLNRSFETKLRLRFHESVATTYCMNPGGRIIRKYEKGYVMPDGQNCNESNSPTENLNFTLFVTDYFTDRQEATVYAKQIMTAVNSQSERIVVQRLEDLRLNRCSADNNFVGNRVTPTLSASIGNLADIVPRHYLDITLEFFQRLGLLLGEPVSPDTLLYAIDAKFFAPEKIISTYFETATDGLFLAGDCSGITGSLSQAATSGLHIANYLNQIRE